MGTYFRKYRVYEMIVLFLVALSLALPQTSSWVSAQMRGATLVVGQGGQVALLDPNRDTGGIAEVTFRAVFDGLTFIDESARVQPALATSWKRVNETTWELNLRSGVRFQNGEPFTAEAVKFSIERIFKPEFKSAVRGRVSSIKSVNVVSPRVVRITTSKPDVLLPRRLAVVFIVPPRYVAKVGDEGFLKAPIGTGPFKVTEYVRLDHITLTATEASWRGVPKLRQVILRNIPDPSARMAALLSRAVDLAQNLPLEALKRFANDKDIRADLVVQARAYSFHFRTRGKPSVVADKRIRQALNYAVNKDAIATGLFAGRVKPLGQVVGPSCFGHNPEVAPYPYDPEKAKALLRDAGYAGERVPLDYTVGSYTGDREMAEAVASDLRAAGVNAVLTPREFSVNIELSDHGNHEALALDPFNCFPMMDADLILQWLTSDNEDNFYNNREFDQLLAESRSEFDSAKRFKILQKIAHLVHDDPTSLFLFEEPAVYGVSRRVRNFRGRPDYVIWFDSISK